MEQYVCITNNPIWVADGVLSDPTFVNGESKDVFIRARDLVHLGWKLLVHPLYGNFDPLGHPYRTLLLEKQGGEDRYTLDMESFTMLEKALESVRRASQDARQRTSNDRYKMDFAVLDKALMEESVRRYIKHIA